MNGYGKLVALGASFGLSLAGAWVAGINSHGERIARVETAVEFVKEQVGHNADKLDRLIESLL